VKIVRNQAALAEQMKNDFSEQLWLKQKGKICFTYFWLKPLYFPKLDH